METAKRLTILLIVTVMVTGSVRSAEQSKETISYTFDASCLIKITCDPVVLPLSFETIDYLLHSSGVGGKAAREVLDISPDQVHDLFTIEYVHELVSDAKSKSSRGRSSGMEDGMYDDEYEMLMEAEMMAGYDMMDHTGLTSSRSRSRDSRTSRRSRRIPSIGRTVTTSGFPIDEQTYLFSLHIQLPEQVVTKPAAEEFMDAILFNLRNALTSAFDEHMQKLKNQLKLADEEAARAEAELGRMQQELRDISGSRILDGDRILGEIEDIRNDIQRLEMEQDSDKVMGDAITRQIAEIQAKIQKDIEDDAVTKELKELVALQQQNFQQVEKLYKSGSASLIDDVADAREKLTRARIELAQRREQLSKSSGGNRIESLNSQLANYTIKEIQNRARLSNLKQQLIKAENLLARADHYEMLSLKIDIAKQNLQETILWRDRMNRRIRMIQPPTVSVIGGD
jgi:hypothetical protein